MAKLAFLICAHQHPEHLGRLVRRLRHPDSSFFIFVDGKADAAPFAAAVQGEPRCQFVEPRHRVYWMGFSCVEAQVALMRAAMDSGTPFKYLVSLTGVDYPIHPVDRIHDFYERQTSEFLRYFSLAEHIDWQHKVSRFYRLDIPAFNRREVFKTRTRTALWLPALVLSRVAARLIPRRASLEGFTLCGGSAHWSLTHACARHVLDVTAAEPRLAAFFRTTHCPDEMYFQTVVVSSRHRENIVGRSAITHWPANRRSRYVTEHGDDLKYVNWDPAREGPAILDERDFPALVSSGKLFARKCHPIVSRGLLDRLDAAPASPVPQ